MEGFEQERRGLFDGLQVPHSLNAIVIAAIALLAYWLGVFAIEQASTGIPGDPERHCRLIAGMLGNVTCRLGTVGYYLSYWGGWANQHTSYDIVVWALFLGWSSVVWAFFSGAINRIAAMKLAREEGLEIKDAFKFAARKFLPNLLSIVFVLAILGFFYLICNATIAGWIGRIPVVGNVLLGVFFFLVLISSFLVVFASALGILGFNLASSAIATEASDTFDGVSRAWNYILARPWTVILTYVATFLYIALILFCGQWFMKVSVKSLTVGEWGLGTNDRTIELDQDLREKLKLNKTMRLDTVVLPGKGEFLYQRLIYHKYKPDLEGHINYRQGLALALERHKAHTGSYPETLMGLIEEPALSSETWFGPYLPELKAPPKDPWNRELVYLPRDLSDPDRYVVSSSGPNGVSGDTDDLTLRQLEAQGERYGPNLDVAPLLGEGTQEFLLYALFFWIKLVATVLLYGYVVAYFFSAQTTTYFLLRKDVEGDDYTEIVLQEGEEGLDFVPRDLPPPSPPQEDGGKKLPQADPA